MPQFGQTHKRHATKVEGVGVVVLLADHAAQVALRPLELTQRHVDGTANAVCRRAAAIKPQSLIGIGHRADVFPQVQPRDRSMPVSLCMRWRHLNDMGKDTCRQSIPLVLQISERQREQSRRIPRSEHPRQAILLSKFLPVIARNWERDRPRPICWPSRRCLPICGIMVLNCSKSWEVVKSCSKCPILTKS